MARLIYSALTSVDGYIADQDGRFDWAEPDDEVHAFVNDLLRPIGTHLYGRRMYETLLSWETAPTDPGQPAVMREFADLWRAADKVVYSTTLETPSSARTRIERRFDPGAVRRMKSSEPEGRDIAIGGPTLAAPAFEAGLVDECHLFLNPVAVGGGTAALPVRRRLDLELLAERRFGNGTVHLGYRVRT